MAYWKPGYFDLSTGAKAQLYELANQMMILVTENGPRTFDKLIALSEE